MGLVLGEVSGGELRSAELPKRFCKASKSVPLGVWLKGLGQLFVASVSLPLTPLAYQSEVTS